MLIQWSSLSTLAVKVFAISALWNGIIVPEETALLELWEQKLDDVLE